MIHSTLMYELSTKLIALCESVPARLREIDEINFTHKPSPEKWSKKEIIGHLIDSAANNHQRFVRTQFETPVIFYEQDHWVNIQQYQKEDKELIITLWEIYNRHLAHVIKHIPEENLEKKTIGRDGKSYTLRFIAEDYLGHLEYHLEEVFDRR